ncbi:hypothetical protein B0H11DRAFT_1862915 [Mycena galericulata]|nr:hypothetical protein B0H11DRAFT_1862915 [Mycena galericulata]
MDEQHIVPPAIARPVAGSGGHVPAEQRSDVSYLISKCEQGWLSGPGLVVPVCTGSAFDVFCLQNHEHSAFLKHPTDHKDNPGHVSSATDFIKRLYKILSDGADEDVIAWAPERDRFVVKDIDKFRTSILPRMFKHSNFASFVRQLNKYGFHKVKIDNQEHAWTFRHPDFHADRPDALDNIRRKAPVQRKAPPITAGSREAPYYSPVECLQTEVASMQTQLDEALSRVQMLRHSHEKVLLEMGAFQQRMAQQGTLIASLVQSILPEKDGISPGETQGSSPSFDPRSLLGRQTQAFPRVSSSVSPRLDRSVVGYIEEFQAQHPPSGARPPQSHTIAPERDSEEYEYQKWTLSPLSEPGSSSEGWSPFTSSGTGSESSTAWPFDGSASAGPGEMTEEASVLTSAGSSRFALPLTSTLRVRQAMSVPRWAAPPHVLVVEDDVISRKLSSKFLQLSGCTVDFAADGVDAVGKVTHGKYDLVFMDIGMPRLDGVSATAMIRTFDQRTPIICMTSSIAPTELAAYSSSGMNDIWAKPFKKEVLVDILKKHLPHLLKRRAAASSMSTNVNAHPFARMVQSKDVLGFDGAVHERGVGSSSANALDDGFGSPLVDEQYNAMVSGSQR